MSKITRSVSFPEKILAEIDRQAETWYCDRSQAITRIYQEWKEARHATRPLPGLAAAELPTQPTKAHHK